MGIITLSALAIAFLSSLPSPASANGFVSLPPSRQARCSNNMIPGCGDVRWSPQSVIAPTGSLSCNGNTTLFPELNNPLIWANRYFTVPAGADSLSFTWSILDSRKTSSFQYFFMPYATGDVPMDEFGRVKPDHDSDGASEGSGWSPLTPPFVLLASFKEENRTVPAIVTHHVPFRGHTGRKTVLAMWNLADVDKTFYSCVDLVVTGGELPVIDDHGGYYSASSTETK